MPAAANGAHGMHVPTGSGGMSRASSGQLAQQDCSDLRREGPVWLQARLAPLHPKGTAQLTLLAAAQDSLFAGVPSALCKSE